MTKTKQENHIKSHYLATNLRILRKRKQLSQEELAQALGLNRGNIASYENGTAEPKIGNFLKMAAYFGISLIDLAQRDLRDAETLASLTRLQGLCPQERSKLERLHETADSFNEFLQGIQSCFLYKIRDLDQYEDLPVNITFLKSHFEQLHAAASKLNSEHQELLKMCQPKD